MVQFSKDEHSMTSPILKNYVKRAESSLKNQRKRSLFFSDHSLFDSPPWELLLEVYIATEHNDCVSRNSLISKVEAPRSIVSRWIDIFAERNYLTSCDTANPDCVKLTDDARIRCSAYLDAIFEDQS